MHPFYQTYSFIPSDNDHLPDLGGTVEFHIGEGKEQEIYIVNKSSTVLIPREYRSPSALCERSPQAICDSNSTGFTHLGWYLGSLVITL